MKYIFLALLVMISTGIADFLLKKGINIGIDVNAFLFLYSFVVTILYGILCLFKKVPLKVRKNLLKYPLIVGIFIFLSTFSLLTALRFEDASVIIPIVRMGFVVTSIFAFTLLREKITFEKALGILFAAVSLILLTQK